MSLTSIGDLAQTLVLRNRSVEIRQQIETLTRELSSGQVADPGSRLGGDFSYLAEMDRGLKRLDAFDVAAAEAGLFAAAMQESIATVQLRVEVLVGDLLTATTAGQPSGRNLASTQAGQALGSLVAVLNGSIGGRALFSGMETGVSPLTGAEELLTGVRSAIAGQTSPADILQAVTSWFDDPAGFDALIYRGSERDLAPIRVSETERIPLEIRANDPALKDILMATALVALATEPGLGLPPVSEAGLISAATDILLNSRDRLTEIRAEIGFSESRIETARVSNSATRTGLEYARAELLAADPFDVASRLEAAQFQLESLYSATVRTSRLSLVNFLK